ncbi:hypothetical protein Egran_05111 [Elaphomyces granulatus]|uniref:Uncharacterized protein n=1 Tax=Elaphomyces granulatus TaxID=519963 RepID=A0A232LSS4_9EURO|nr:hypothetical protein Egran_05111 [Elaphomyces granulatus]
MQLYTFSNSTLSSRSPSSLPPPPPPPPSPNDTLLDITPRESMAMGISASCAFPSWPNRSTLLSKDSDSAVSSYLSDEDLFPTGIPSSSSETVNEESGTAVPVIVAPDLTIEEQIQMIRAAAEEDEGRMHAHARAEQAHRAAHLAAAERENAKRRPVVEKKRTHHPLRTRLHSD